MLVFATEEQEEETQVPQDEEGKAKTTFQE